ncbi:hypothetical protein [Streptomyces sp. NBC_01262]|uniref:hypothetical protein n=1 Tax=Streptomyces sp. NBC_01262 TaxID=2903803 RepID=UPI002E30C8CC|nr:hypothetical protein [Streptomyces sp. NBC_01262]
MNSVSRSKFAGRSAPLFSDDAVDLIHLTSHGLPRSVNDIAMQSLIAAFADEKSILDNSSTRLAVRPRPDTLAG